MARLLAATSTAILATAAVLLGGAPQANAVASTVSVPATQAWTDTGIDVGGSVILQASGTIQVGGPELNLGPTGSTANCVAGPESFSGSWVANGFPCWSLIARVGNGPAFYVGQGGTFSVPPARLFLGVNDETAAFGDNSGSWTVQVTRSAASRSLSYYALGDSYSSGEGVPPFYEDAKTSCHRSTSAYSTVFAAAAGHSLGSPPKTGHSPSHFVACSGAKGTDLFDFPGQIGVLRGSNAQLVTLTVGGNDVEVWDPTKPTERYGGRDGGLAAIFTECVRNVFAECTRLSSSNMPSLPPVLYNGYLKLKNEARGARFIVLTYPLIFHPAKTCNGTFGLTSLEIFYITNTTKRLNEAIRSAAGWAGIEVLDVENAFENHWVCSKTSWAIGAQSDLRNTGYWFHPNKEGQAELARRLDAVA